MTNRNWKLKRKKVKINEEDWNLYQEDADNKNKRMLDVAVAKIQVQSIRTFGQNP